MKPSHRSAQEQNRISLVLNQMSLFQKRLLIIRLRYLIVRRRINNFIMTVSRLVITSHGIIVDRRLVNDFAYPDKRWEGGVRKLVLKLLAYFELNIEP